MSMIKINQFFSHPNFFRAWSAPLVPVSDLFLFARLNLGSHRALLNIQIFPRSIQPLARALLGPFEVLDLLDGAESAADVDVCDVGEVAARGAEGDVVDRLPGVLAVVQAGAGGRSQGAAAMEVRRVLDVDGLGLAREGGRLRCAKPNAGGQGLFGVVGERLLLHEHVHAVDAVVVLLEALDLALAQADLPVLQA